MLAAATFNSTAALAHRADAQQVGATATSSHQEHRTAGAAGQARVQQRLRTLENEFDARIGAYAFDTGTSRVVGYRANELFPMTSTFKAMACAAVLHKARTADPGLMERVIQYTQDDLVDYSPITKEHVGTGMTVTKLCHATITVSDNTAGNLVLRQLGGPPGLTEYLRSLGDPRSRLDRYETALNDWQPGERRDTTTPALMAQDLRVVMTDALTAPDRDQMAEWLRANTTGAARIRAGLPVDWVVGDKTGTGGTYATANDIAVVWPPNGAPIVIAVYTNRHTRDATVNNEVVARTATALAEGLDLLH
ncbi:MAG: class A beta-lactamase [Flavobacterium sp.]|nr:class A beta-lactamase [Aeromicrobium sp.]